jgi:diguanylate cyclase (GGDEF)-like protein
VSYQLQNLDFQRFGPILQRLVPSLECLAVVNSAFAPEYTHGQAKGCLEISELTYLESLSKSEKTVSESATDCTVSIPLNLFNDGFVLFVVARASYPAGQNRQAFVEDLCTFLADINTFISKELVLQLELDEMAEELGRRYEELNLVYSVKDHAETSALMVGRGNRSLQQLVDDCATFLNVGLAAIYVPGNSLLIKSLANSSDNPVAISDSQLQQCYELTKNAKRAVVVNSSEEVLKYFDDFGSDLKVIASPITAENSRLGGVFVVLKQDRVGEFSNSDRQLVEIQAEMTRKIICSRYDGLTGLLNGHEFESKFSQILKGEKYSCLLLVFSFNNIKFIVEKYGFEVSNTLLLGFTEVLIRRFTGGQLIARIEVNEFAVILQKQDAIHYQKIIDQLLDEMALSVKNQRNIPDDCGFNITVGIVTHQTGLRKASDWIIAGDIACELAKSDSFRRQHSYCPDDEKLTEHKAEMAWLSKVRSALIEQRFVLYCQPMESLTGGPPHFEILLRVIDEDGEISSPAKFIDAAERYDLMPSIDEWVVTNALKILSERQVSEFCPESIWSINLSGQSLSSDKFKRFLLSALHNTVVENRQICFEITETAAIDQFEKALNLITSLKAVGASFSLDDFGSGLSSFSYLKEIPVDYLKIDGSFVKDIETNNLNFSMVQAMHGVGKLMGLTTIAEFVASEKCKDMLKSIGIDYAQGYIVSKPISLQQAIIDLKKANKADSKPSQSF